MGMQVAKATIEADVKLTGEARRIRNEQLRHERLLRQAISDLNYSVIFGAVIVAVGVVFGAIIGAN